MLSSLSLLASFEKNPLKEKAEGICYFETTEKGSETAFLYVSPF